jgi:hypothetical protein
MIILFSLFLCFQEGLGIAATKLQITFIVFSSSIFIFVQWI